MKRLVIAILKRYWKLLLSVLLVSAMGCGIMTGLSGAYQSLQGSLEGYVASGAYPDAVLTTDLTSREQAARLAQVPDVRFVDARIFGDTTFRAGTDRLLSVRAFSFSEDDQEKFYYWSWTDPEGDAIYLEYNFARDNGIFVGDTLHVNLNEEVRDVTVSAIVSRPETLAVHPASGESWSMNADFGYAYVPLALLAREAEAPYSEAKKELDEARAELLEAKNELDKGEAALSEARQVLDEARDEFERLRETLSDVLSQLEESEQALSDARVQIEESRTQLEASQQELNMRAAPLSSARAELDHAQAQINASQAEINAAKAELDRQAEQYSGGIYSLLGAPSQIQLGYQRLEEAQAEVNSARAQLNARWGEYYAAMAPINEAQAQINEGYATLTQAEQALAAKQAEFDEANASLAEGRQQLREAEQALADKQAEFDDANSEFSAKQAEWEEADAALQEGQAKLEASRYDQRCNQFLLYFEPDADPAATLAAAEAALQEVQVIDCFLYADSAVKKRIDINLEPIETMSIFMPLVFFVIILIVVFLFMSLIIRQSRREIGILRALGISGRQIQALFCAVNGVVSLVSVVLGTVLGIGIMAYVGSAYGAFFPLPVFSYHLSLPMCLLSVLLTLAVGQAATLLSTGIIARILPSEAMSRPTPNRSAVPGPLQRLLRPTPPMVKFSLVSLLRNPLRFVFSVICVAASVMMIFSSLAFLSSKNYILRELFDQRIRYDCQIFFQEPPESNFFDALEELGITQNAVSMPYYQVEITSGNQSASATAALLPGTELVGVYAPDGARLSAPERGILLERHLAQELGVGPGDQVFVNQVALTIADLSEQSISRLQYLSPTAAEALGAPDLGTVILQVRPEDEAELLAFLSKQPGYRYAVFTRLAYESNQKVFRTYDLAAWLIIVSALLLGLVIVSNTAQTNVLEKKKELCILRTLGFQFGEISRSWFSQSLLHFLCSLCVGLPAGVAVAKVALQKLSTEGREYVFASGPKEYALTILLVLAYVIISHLYAMHALKTWDLAECIKEKE